MTIPLYLSDECYRDLVALAEERGMTSTQLVSTWIRTGRRRDIKPYGAGDAMRFGRYGGEPVENIIRTDPAYIKWLLNNATERFVLDAEMQALYDRMAQRKAEEVPAEVRRTGWWRRMTGGGK